MAKRINVKLIMELSAGGLTQNEIASSRHFSKTSVNLVLKKMCIRDRIRSIRRHLSTMTTYVIPRPLLAEAKKLSGINRPGIYYLISENDDNKIAQIYIGQTRNGVVRLDDHNRSKDFWNKAIMFLADNKTFSLDMISGLEAYAIGKAHDSKRYRVCLLYTSFIIVCCWRIWFRRTYS